MLQKAIRRNKPGYAMYAAYELYEKYYSMLWKRLLVISAEDCYGIITKEIVKLKMEDDKNNAGLKGYSRDFKYVKKAVELLCANEKNRDGCYVACNFMTADWGCSEKEFQEIGHITFKELNDEIGKEAKQCSLF